MSSQQLGDARPIVDGPSDCLGELTLEDLTLGKGR
jgi:hypothetical protein